MSTSSTPVARPAAGDTPAAADPHVAAIRQFNRFYTQRIGVLSEGLLDSPLSLTQARVLWELAHRDAPTAAELARDLALDPGYLSRILRGFARDGLVERRPSPSDSRRAHLALTAAGRATFDALDRRTADDVAALLAPLTAEARRRVVGAMREIRETLGDRPAGAASPPYIIRPPAAGDLGWVVERHGVLYAREYGWDERFEGLVARVIADYVEKLEPRRERAWIAEREGERVGCIFLMRHREREGVAQLRLLLVEPSARGLGIGARLVRECIRTARDLGYRTMMLWTNDVLGSARRIYQAEGFRLVKEEKHRYFGPELNAQEWE